MKQLALKKLSETLEVLMREQGISIKELAEKANMSYSSLLPILNGSRECRVSKILALADALSCTPDVLLKDLYQSSSGRDKLPKKKAPPKFLAVFISIVKVTYCLLYDVERKKSVESVQQFPLRCGDDAEFFIGNIINALTTFSEKIKNKIELKDVSIFASVQQYGRKANREKIQVKGDHFFSKLSIEADAITNYQTFFGEKNGICISINDGCMVTYSLDEGKTIERLQGYGFPISDTAGNIWLGCEAIKHVLAVKEGKEQSSVLSDRLLGAFNDDVIFLSASALEVPSVTYQKASSILKELAYQKKSREILQKSADFLLEDVSLIDEKTKTELLIFISGELAELYQGLFPKERLLKLTGQQTALLLEHGLKKLKLNTLDE